MQMGLGLPFRDVLPGIACNELRTALNCKQPTVSGSGTVLTQLKYGDLATLFPPGTDEKPDEPGWLWRGSIQDYDRISRPLQKWVARLLRWTIAFRQQQPPGAWQGGFKGYDDLEAFTFSVVKDYPSFGEFAGLCDFLREELKAAMRR